MIVSSAIKWKGAIYTSKRHSDVIRMMKSLGVITMEDKPSIEDQGFVDDYGVFLDREQAKALAIQWGQVPEDFEGTLHSEDLWQVKELTERETGGK